MIGIGAGIAAYTAAAGAGITAAGAIAIGVAATAASMLLEQGMAMHGKEGAKAIDDSGADMKGTPIDKTKMQEESELGKLQLGEDNKKDKRKRGKAAFKIDLDKEKQSTGETPQTGVQVNIPSGSGVQL